ncbi:hypothetical protein ACBQ88_17300 [Citrobacter braakii]|uniref:hypothetical protein n=1 Tax=Citrobacter braakii TaxID=57706 RepID=UPI0035259DCB
MEHANDSVIQNAKHLVNIITLLNAQCVDVLRVTLRGAQLVIRVKHCETCERWIKGGDAYHFGTVAHGAENKSCWAMDFLGCRIVWTKGIY